MLSDSARNTLLAFGIDPDGTDHISADNFSGIIDYLRSLHSASVVDEILESIIRYAVDAGRSSHADLYRSSMLSRPSAPVTPNNNQLYLALCRFDGLFPEIMLNLSDNQVPGALIYGAMRYGLLIDKDLIRSWRETGFVHEIRQYKNYLWILLSKNVESEPIVWQPDDLTLFMMVRYKERLFLSKGTSWYRYLTIFLRPYIDIADWPSMEVFIDAMIAVLKNFVPSYLVEISTNRNRNRSLTEHGHLRLISRMIPDGVCVSVKSENSDRGEGRVSRKQRRSRDSDTISSIVHDCDSALDLIDRSESLGFSLPLMSLIRCAGFYIENDTEFGTRLERSGVVRIVNNLSTRFKHIFKEVDPESLSSDYLVDSLQDMVLAERESSQKNLRVSVNYYLWYLHHKNDRGYLCIEDEMREGKFSHPAMVLPWEYDAIKSTLRRQLSMSSRSDDKQRDKYMLLALIFGYRSGLRRGEITSLRYRDIHLLGLSSIVISRHGDFKPKTQSGNRQVVVSGRYDEQELSLIKSIVSARIHSSCSDEEFIFGHYEVNSNSTNNKKIFEELTWIIRSVTGDKNASFHSLRHSFASINIYRMIRSRWLSEYPVDDHLDYDTGENYDVYLSRLSPLAGASRRVNPIYQISAEMGHASPITTLCTYVHSLDWILPLYQRRMMPEFSSAQLAIGLGISRQAIQKTARAEGRRKLSDYRLSMVRKLKNITTVVDLSGWYHPWKNSTFDGYNKSFEFDGVVTDIRHYDKGKITLRNFLRRHPVILRLPSELLKDFDLMKLFSALYLREEKSRGDNILKKFSELTPSEQKYCVYRWQVSREIWLEHGLKRRPLEFRSVRSEKSYQYLVRTLGIFDASGG